MPQPVFSPCSIPLLPGQIPGNVDFKLKQVAPPMAKPAPMPQTKGPAPACATWPPR
jgi:hypothetical protein